MNSSVDAITIVNFVLYGINNLTFLVGISLFLKYRKSEFIKARQPAIVILAAISLEITQVIQILTNAFTYEIGDCITRFYVQVFSGALAFTSLAIRMYRLRVVMLLNGEYYTKLVEEKGEEPLLANKVSRLKKIVYTNKLYQILAIILLAHIAIAGLFHGIYKIYNTGGTTECDKDPFLLDLVDALYVVYIITMIYFVVTIRKIHDYYRIAFEIKCVLLNYAIFIVIGLVFAQISPRLANIVGLVPVPFDFFMYFFYPVYKAKQDQELDQKAGFSESLPPLQNVLEDEEILKLFEEFLVSESSIENLLFIKQVKEYQQNTTSSKQIYDLFIKDGAALQINLSFNVSSKIISTMGNPDDGKELFKDAEREIKNLLSYDSLKRFLNSRQYSILLTRRELLEKLNYKPRLSGSNSLTSLGPNRASNSNVNSVELL